MDLFWGDIPHRMSTYLSFKKRIIRITMGTRLKDSCREYFKTLQILPLASQYILSIALFMIQNKDLFKMNSEKHKFNTRVTLIFSSQWLTQRYVRKGLLLQHQVFNNLPLEIRRLSDNVEQVKKLWANFYYNNLFICVMNILVINPISFKCRNVV